MLLATLGAIVVERKYFTCPSWELNPGRWIYRQTLYHFAVKAGFYRKAVEVSYIPSPVTSLSSFTQLMVLFCSHAPIQKISSGRSEWGCGPDNVFLVITVFHRGPYGPPSRSNWTFLEGVHTIVFKETYSHFLFIPRDSGFRDIFGEIPLFNTLIPYGISHSYRLEASISNLMAVR